MDEKIFTIKATVAGKVQGVGFRAKTLALAKKLKLAGSVSNMQSGEVEITLKGSQQQCDDFFHQIEKEFSQNITSIKKEKALLDIDRDDFNII